MLCEGGLQQQMLGVSLAEEDVLQDLPANRFAGEVMSRDLGAKLYLVFQKNIILSKSIPFLSLKVLRRVLREN